MGRGFITPTFHHYLAAPHASSPYPGLKTSNSPDKIIAYIPVMSTGSNSTSSISELCGLGQVL